MSLKVRAGLTLDATPKQSLINRVGCGYCEKRGAVEKMEMVFPQVFLIEGIDGWGIYDWGAEPRPNLPTVPKVILGSSLEEAKKGFFKEWDDFRESPVTSVFAQLSEQLFQDLIRLAIGIPLNPRYMATGSCIGTTATSPYWYNKAEKILLKEMKKEAVFLRQNPTIKAKRLNRMGRLSEDGSEMFFGKNVSAPFVIAEIASRIRPEFYLLSPNEGIALLKELAGDNEFAFKKLKELTKLFRCLGEE